MKTQKVYRHELKYFINYGEYVYLRNMLGVILKKDEFTKETNDYWIRSLYFDDVSNSDYYNKEMGVKVRKKIRLRIYDTAQETVKLEIKNRDDQYMFKETIVISKADAKSLIGGNYEALLGYDSDTARKAYSLMKSNLYQPKIVIDYNREAYTYPLNNIRITFDKNLKASREVAGFFDEGLPVVNVFNEEKVILEVKYNNILPEVIREVLGTAGGYRSSISKYCLGRQYIGF